MNSKIIAFDIETPNRCNNRICSIGITTVEESGEITSREYLINPECEFDAFNVNLHGVSPTMIQNAPTFPEIWKELGSLFINNLLLAHNARFDLSVLKKTLAAYGIPAQTVHYVCTLQIAQDALNDLNSFRLPSLCEYYGIPLSRHHEAGNDSEACARVFLAMQADKIKEESYVMEYDLSCESSNSHNRHGKHISDTSKALKELNSVLKGISCDGVLTPAEMDYLSQWMEEHSGLRGNYPYDVVYNELVRVFADGVIDENEERELLNLFETMDKPTKQMNHLSGLLDIEGKNICLSGDFDFGTKDEVGQCLISKGALIQNTVTKKTDILLVGNRGSQAWSMGNYGSKIKKALEMQEKGMSILILQEGELLK